MERNRTLQIIYCLLTLVSFFAFAQVNGNEGSNAGTSVVQERKTNPDIEVFVREGCPHCEAAKTFLTQLAKERPGINIVIRDLYHDPDAVVRLQSVAKVHQRGALRVPAFYINGQLLVGFADASTTGKLILEQLSKAGHDVKSPDAGSCTPVIDQSCGNGEQNLKTDKTGTKLTFFGQKISLEQVGLPLFTLFMGLLDGFNPCSLWVLLLMISLLAPMRDRLRMLAVAGTFVLVEGVAYFLFMASWLNLFLWVGISKVSQILIASLALLAGLLNLKDFWAFGRGFSLAIPEASKPGIYAKIRGILNAENLSGAIIGAAVLAVMVQLVELMCTSGFPALYTRILTLEQMPNLNYYGYLLLYNLAYMFDDLIILGIGVITLSQRRLQQNEGRWLKLVSGLVMIGLGLHLLVT